MRRFQRTKKKTKVVVPGGKTVVRFKQRKPTAAKCGNCGTKLNRSKLTPTQLKNIPKVRRRPERPKPHLCPGCMKEEMKNMVRG